MDWLEWFDDKRDGWITLQVGEFGHRSVKAEELYQVFKARMIAEIAVTSDELLNPAQLIDITDG